MEHVTIEVLIQLNMDWALPMRSLCTLWVVLERWKLAFQSQRLVLNHVWGSFVIDRARLDQFYLDNDVVVVGINLDHGALKPASQMDKIPDKPNREEC